MSALYILKKNALLRGRTASQADEDSKADLSLDRADECRDEIRKYAK